MADFMLRGITFPHPCPHRMGRQIWQESRGNTSAVTTDGGNGPIAGQRSARPRVVGRRNTSNWQEPAATQWPGRSRPPRSKSRAFHGSSPLESHRCSPYGFGGASTPDKASTASGRRCPWISIAATALHQLHERQVVGQVLWRESRLSAANVTGGEPCTRVDGASEETDPQRAPWHHQLLRRGTGARPRATCEPSHERSCAHRHRTLEKVTPAASCRAGTFWLIPLPTHMCCSLHRPTTPAPRWYSWIPYVRMN